MKITWHRARLTTQSVLGALLVVSCAVFSAEAAGAQTFDMTMDVLVNSTNTTGYNTSSTSPGEYQRYLNVILNAILSISRFRIA
jgi:hypothetical protein